MNRRIIIIGAGAIGLSAALQCARKGHQVTVLERNGPQRNGCSFGNAGMIVPSHFVPLAAPGMVKLGLKWMLNPESPFYIKPRLDRELFDWALKFWRAANAEHVRRSAPLLRDLSFASRALFEEFAGAPASDPALPESKAVTDRGENPPSRSRIEPLNCSSRREEALTSVPEFQMEPPHVGCYEVRREDRRAIGDFGLVTRGLLMLCKTPHALEDEADFAAQANQLGVPAEVLDAKQVAKLDPDVTMDVAGAVYFPKDAHFTPDRYLAALQNECEKLGVSLVWNAEVSKMVSSKPSFKVTKTLYGKPGGGISQEKTTFRQNQNCIEAILTAKGEFSADEFVLCGGSWSPLLVRDLGLRIPIQPGKGYSLTLARPRELPQLCSIFTEARLAVTPMGSSLRFGGTMEMAGLTEEINPVRVQGILKAVPKYFPKFSPSDFAGIEPWSGLRPCSPDGLPYLGRTAKYSNVIVATGHAMMGMSLSPITGKLVTEIVSGEKPSFDVSQLSPDRFA
jgi:glycine/D-amino acid oxidase-like deaminating enzyme